MMKSFLFYNNLYLLLIILFFSININFAYTKENIEDDFKDIAIKLRCMTCQNQTVYDSDEDFSKDLKTIIKQKLKEGESQKEIIDFFVKRYGEYIVFEPKFDKKNIFLWTFPFFALLISAIILFVQINKKKVIK